MPRSYNSKIKVVLIVLRNYWIRDDPIIWPSRCVQHCTFLKLRSIQNLWKFRLFVGPLFFQQTA